ncbi:MAG: hypothetical protein QM736_14110 [Vicinamibacterales bacterium]
MTVAKRLPESRQPTLRFKLPSKVVVRDEDAPFARLRMLGKPDFTGGRQVEVAYQTPLAWPGTISPGANVSAGHSGVGMV